VIQIFHQLAGANVAIEQPGQFGTDHGEQPCLLHDSAAKQNALRREGANPIRQAQR